MLWIIYFFSPFFVLGFVFFLVFLCHSWKYLGLLWLCSGNTFGDAHRSKGYQELNMGWPHTRQIPYLCTFSNLSPFLSLFKWLRFSDLWSNHGFSGTQFQTHLYFLFVCLFWRNWPSAIRFTKYLEILFWGHTRGCSGDHMGCRLILGLCSRQTSYLLYCCFSLRMLSVLILGLS